MLLSLVFHHNRSDLPTAAILRSGVCIALLSVIRMVGAGYLEETERVSREGVEILQKEGATAVVATWGEKVIGAAVVRGGELWAWTVESRYKRMGLGGIYL